MDNVTPKTQQPPNRIAIPLQFLEAKDTTLTHAKLKETLKHNKDTLKSLKTVNAGLCVLILMAFVYLLLQLLFAGSRQAELHLPGIETDMPFASSGGLPVESHRVDALRQLVKKRSLFEPAVISDEIRQAAFDKAKSDILKKFRVVGIFIAGKPQAIIELAGGNETVFVGEGEKVEGALVKKIYEDKVVMVYDGIELDVQQ